jgi:hypothetical protein
LEILNSRGEGRISGKLNFEGNSLKHNKMSLRRLVNNYSFKGYANKRANPNGASSAPPPAKKGKFKIKEQPAPQVKPKPAPPVEPPPA